MNMQQLMKQAQKMQEQLHKQMQANTMTPIPMRAF